MSVLSDKIIQLITYEEQLKTLKKEIVLQYIALADTPEVYIHNHILEEQLKEYELISTKYHELFEDILPDMNRMTEEYQEVRNRSKLLEQRSYKRYVNKSAL
jgi:GTPase involved in cell partitioning and DNA repair